MRSTDAKERLDADKATLELATPVSGEKRNAMAPIRAIYAADATGSQHVHTHCPDSGGECNLDPASRRSLRLLR